MREMNGSNASMKTWSRMGYEGRAWCHSRRLLCGLLSLCLLALFVVSLVTLCTHRPLSLARSLSLSNKTLFMCIFFLWSCLLFFTTFHIFTVSLVFHSFFALSFWIFHDPCVFSLHWSCDCSLSLCFVCAFFILPHAPCASTLYNLSSDQLEHTHKINICKTNTSGKTSTRTKNKHILR